MTNIAKTTTADTPAPYGLASIKEAGGEETPRFEAKITLNGKAIGIVSNEGTGGCNRYHFSSPAERDAFEAWIAANHPAKYEADDAWVYKQLDAHAMLKQLVRWSKKQTVFLAGGEKPGEYRTIKAVGPQAVDVVRRKYPGASVFDGASKSWLVVR